MRPVGVIICATLLISAVSARGNPVINLGHYYVVKDASVPADILVSDAGNPATEDVEGMQLTLQLGSGILSTPSIGSVDFLTGTIWSGRVSASNINTVVVAGSGPQYKSWGLLTDNAGAVNANGKLATVSLSAVGASPGDYLVKMTGTAQSSANSKFFNGSGAVVPATFADGKLTVVIRGDYDRNDQLTAGDISVALSALSGLDAYKEMKGLSTDGLIKVGDVDVSGAVDNRDLQSLLISLANSGGGGGLNVVPEPATWMLAFGALVSLSIVKAAVGFRHGRCRR
jgi:hypothetical protein